MCLSLQENYTSFCNLDSKGMCYRFEVSMSGPAIELHNCMAKLLAHPLQRPFQSHASYSLLEGEDPQDIEATVWRGLFHTFLHSNNFIKLFTLSSRKFIPINESVKTLRKNVMEGFGCKSTGERLGFVKGSFDTFLISGCILGEIKSKLSLLSVFKMCLFFFEMVLFNHSSFLYVPQIMEECI